VPEADLTILVVPGGRAQCSNRTQAGKFAASSAVEVILSQTNDPQQGARLVRAFFQITDPGVRLAIVQMVAKMGCARKLLGGRV
jgi:hypothetical protein